MYRLRGQTRVNNMLLTEHPDFKDRIMYELVNEFAKEMHKKDCLELTEVKGNSKDVNWMSTAETEFNIEGFVMTLEEFVRIREILLLLKTYTSLPYYSYLQEIDDILTKEPNT